MRRQGQRDRQEEAQAREEALKRRWTLFALALALAAPASAGAAIDPPTVIDGPSPEIVEFGGAAMAADGSGGVVYTKLVGGVPHVFVGRYQAGSWSDPIRVDQSSPYEASQPRIAAGKSGRLLVVWVTPRALVHGRIRYGLVSAALGPSANEFGPLLLVDPDVGAAGAVDPSVSGVAPGEATIAYRAVTNDFSLADLNRSAKNQTDVQLRPGDVMAEIRVARLNGDRWSLLGPLNRSTSISMRAPSVLNAPQVGTAASGAAVVAWQEPEADGTARIWARRVFSSQLGPVLPVSPPQLEGKAVAADVDAFSLAVTPFGGAEVAMRLAAAGSPFGASRILLNSLPNGAATEAKQFAGAALADGGAAGTIGPPSVAAVDKGKEVRVGIGFAAGPVAQLRGGDPAHLGPLAEPVATAPEGTPVVAAMNPVGGGVLAWPSRRDNGEAGVGVREELPTGATQTGFVVGDATGVVEDLTLGAAPSGDAMLAFRQGDAGTGEIVAAPFSAPPVPFGLVAPKSWVSPRAARISWTSALRGGAGLLSFGVLLDGRLVASRRGADAVTLPRTALGDGVHQVQVVATDEDGGQYATPTGSLKVDALPPSATAKALGHGRVLVRVVDPESGAVPAKTRCRFGDGATAKQRLRFRHTYARPGVHRIVVHVRDRVGNAATLRLPVRVR